MNGPNVSLAGPVRYNVFVWVGVKSGRTRIAHLSNSPRNRCCEYFLWARNITTTHNFVRYYIFVQPTYAVLQASLKNPVNLAGAFSPPILGLYKTTTSQSTFYTFRKASVLRTTDCARGSGEIGTYGQCYCQQISQNISHTGKST